MLDTTDKLAKVADSVTEIPEPNEANVVEDVVDPKTTEPEALHVDPMVELEPADSAPARTADPMTEM